MRLSPPLFAAALILVACSCQQEALTTKCEPGSRQGCSCANGADGVQVCPADGRDWDECACACVDCEGVCCAGGQVCFAGACCDLAKCGGAGRECGAQDDGCGGQTSCGDCATSQACVDGECECRFASCLSGCCDQGQVCSSGSCCTPDCSGLSCATDPICGVPCGECPYAQSCINDSCGLNILTLNMMGASYPPLDYRFEPVVRLLTTTPVDIAMFQEAAGGLSTLLGNDMVPYLVQTLAEQGVQYDFVARDMTGIPGINMYQLGVISLNAIVFSDIRWILTGTDDAWERKVLMVATELSGYGRVDAYTSHLGYGDGMEGFLLQGERIFQFIDDINAAHGAPRLTIIGGDMNMITSPTTPHPLYQLFLEHGFTDSYAILHADGGATFAVTGNPYVPNDGNPRRIDYIFVKGSADVVASEVVFDTTGEFVSDHSGVLSTLVLR
jgi:endonuclease/exonuclease/phosphatase family metal-dependent hydrolase